MIRIASRSNKLLHADGKRAILEFVCNQQNPDGGFRGRSPVSDVYYTVFGLSCQIALDHPVATHHVQPFLASLSDLDFIHLTAAARCHLLLGTPAGVDQAIPYLHKLAQYRSQDGGYHHTTKNAQTGSVYGAFLACLTYQEAGRSIPEPQALHAAVTAMRTSDGGFANEANMEASTTTATAAAIVTQQLHVPQPADALALAALDRCIHPAGGYGPFAGAAMPDLLSTATSLYALKTSGVKPISPPAHEAFITSLWTDDGGFCGHALDNQTDVEYTFYALLSLGCAV